MVRRASNFVTTKLDSAYGKLARDRRDTLWLKHILVDY